MQLPELNVTNPDVERNTISIDSGCQQPNQPTYKKIDTDKNLYKKTDTNEILSVCSRYAAPLAKLTDSPWHQFSNPLNHFDCRKLSKLQKLIIDFFHRYYFSKAKPCYMKTCNLAKKFGVRKTSFLKALASLEKRKFIIRFQWFDEAVNHNRTMILPNWNRPFSPEENLEILNGYENGDPPLRNGDPLPNTQKNQTVTFDAGSSSKLETETEGGLRFSFNLPKSLINFFPYKYCTILYNVVMYYLQYRMKYNYFVIRDLVVPTQISMAETNNFYIKISNFTQQEEPCTMHQKPIRHTLSIKPSDSDFSLSIPDIPLVLKNLILDAKKENRNLFSKDNKDSDHFLMWLKHNTHCFDFNKIMGRRVIYSKYKSTSLKAQKLAMMYAETFLFKKSLNFDVSERLVNYWNGLCDSKKLGKVILKKYNRVELAIAFTYYLIDYSEKEIRNMLDRIKKFSNTIAFNTNTIRLIDALVNPFDNKNIDAIIYETDPEYQNTIFKYDPEYPQAAEVAKEFFIDTFYWRNRKTGELRFSQFQSTFSRFTDSLIQQIVVFKKEMCGLKLFKMTGENGSSTLPVLFQYMHWFGENYPLKIHNLCNLEMFGTFAAQEIRGKRGYANFWRNQLKNS